MKQNNFHHGNLKRKTAELNQVLPLPILMEMAVKNHIIMFGNSKYIWLYNNCDGFCMSGTA